jgi:hypothetical protein
MSLTPGFIRVIAFPSFIGFVDNKNHVNLVNPVITFYFVSFRLKFGYPSKTIFDINSFHFMQYVPYFYIFVGNTI